MPKVGWIAALLVALGWLAPLAAAAAPGGAAARRFPDVLRVEVRRTGPRTYSFDVTISSPDTGWEKYTNAFRVRTLGGGVLGTRILYHPHVAEQPFTRSLPGVRIPGGVREVVVDARDSVEGWGGRSLRVRVPAAE